jgi:hypothetical protein
LNRQYRFQNKRKYFLPSRGRRISVSRAFAHFLFSYSCIQQSALDALSFMPTIINTRKKQHQALSFISIPKNSDINDQTSRLLRISWAKNSTLVFNLNFSGLLKQIIYVSNSEGNNQRSDRQSKGGKIISALLTILH